MQVLNYHQEINFLTQTTSPFKRTQNISQHLKRYFCLGLGLKFYVSRSHFLKYKRLRLKNTVETHRGVVCFLDSELR